MRAVSDDPWSPPFARQVYAILVRLAGASNDEHTRDYFVFHQTRERPPTEWRFMGDLGFGGKLYRNGFNPDQPLYVTCYPEDETPERKKTIEKTNRALRELCLHNWTENIARDFGGK